MFQDLTKVTKGFKRGEKDQIEEHNPCKLQIL